MHIRSPFCRETVSIARHFDRSIRSDSKVCAAEKSAIPEGHPPTVVPQTVSRQHDFSVHHTVFHWIASFIAMTMRAAVIARNEAIQKSPPFTPLSRKSPTCAIIQPKFLTSPQRLTDEVANFDCFRHKSETCARMRGGLPATTTRTFPPPPAPSEGGYVRTVPLWSNVT